MKYEIILQGGFANQLFQLAHALDTHPLNSDACFILNKYNYVRYHRSESIAELFPNNISRTNYRKKNIKLLKVRNTFDPYTKLVFENSPFHKSETIEIPKRIKRIVQIGYFQNYNSISNHGDFIFGPLRERLGDSRSVKQNEIAIHIRRGDYINNKLAFNYHGIPSDEFYLRAYESFLTKLSNPEFTVFSDDIEYCRKLYSDRYIKEFVEPSENGHISDFVFLSKFQNYIISNSSFSYVAAHLNKKPNLIIAPKFWVREQQTKNTDLHNNILEYIHI